MFSSSSVSQFSTFNLLSLFAQRTELNLREEDCNRPTVTHFPILALLSYFVSSFTFLFVHWFFSSLRFSLDSTWFLSLRVSSQCYHFFIYSLVSINHHTLPYTPWDTTLRDDSLQLVSAPSLINQRALPHPSSQPLLLLHIIALLCSIPPFCHSTLTLELVDICTIVSVSTW